jgi:fructose-1,6-bisphosphatase II
VADTAFFAASGVNGGPLLGRPRSSGGTTVVESLLITDGQIRHVTHTTFDRATGTRREQP